MGAPICLVGDIGGTNARFAISTNGVLRAEAGLRCDDFADPAAALEHYFATAAVGERPRQAALALATPATSDHFALTNSHWRFSAAELRRTLGFERLILLNDFTALALSIPHLQPGDRRQVGGGRAAADGAIALIGPGTGLGVSGLLPGVDGFHAIAGEGGHVTLAASSEREWQILQYARRQFAHVSAERLLSGPGLELLYQALCALNGRGDPSLNAAQITEQALAGDHGPCREALELFCSWLGAVAGDLALTLGALGGVYIGGGIVPRLGAFFDSSPFRTRFEAKGRFAAYLSAIPVYVVTARNPALLGCARAFVDQSPRFEVTGSASGG